MTTAGRGGSGSGAPGAPKRALPSLRLLHAFSEEEVCHFITRGTRFGWVPLHKLPNHRSLLRALGRFSDGAEEVVVPTV